MKKVLVIGCVGSGKSTFGKRLSRELGLKLFSTDKIVFDKDWKRRVNTEKNKRLRKISLEKGWILEGLLQKSLLWKLIWILILLYFLIILNF